MVRPLIQRTCSDHAHLSHISLDRARMFRWHQTNTKTHRQWNLLMLQKWLQNEVQNPEAIRRFILRTRVHDAFQVFIHLHVSLYQLPLWNVDPTSFPDCAVWYSQYVCQ